jgi:solute carrier family 13 (sodium-dependent dicarboxylate transporter), member 2/3/5
MPRVLLAGIVARISARWSLSMIAMGVAVGGLVAYLPEHAGLAAPGHHALFVLVLASCLWITGALPPFAVSLLVIALQIALLGDPAGEFSDGDPRRWEMFVAPWASPVMWLFLSGLVLAAAAQRTGLDRRLAAAVLGAVGDGPRRLLLGMMSITFVLSMFMSNTATTAMMLALVTPMASSGAMPPLMARGLLVGVAVAANIGGMGTLIGTPPNAIAAAALAGSQPIDYARWMVFGLPPALFLVTVAWLFLSWRYVTAELRVALPEDFADDAPGPGRARSQTLVALIFGVTVAAWMTEQLHGIPTAVVAVMPIAALAVSGVVTERELRLLPWDVLVLVAGGLSLGVGVAETGLAAWLVGGIDAGTLPPAGLALAMAVPTSLLSNFISNTAAATIVMPMAMALGGAAPALIAIPLALTTSTSMCLPVSTPPNALVFASGHVTTRDLVGVGLLVGLVGPPVAIGWTLIVARWLLP